MNYLSAPASKVAELVERLAAIADADQINEVSLAKIRSEAMHMMHSDAASAHTVLGCIAGLRGDAKGAREHHRIAVQLRADVLARYNYAVTLSLLEENEEALRVSMEALAQAPGSLALLDQAIKLAMASGHFSDATSLCTRWETLSPDRPHEAADTARLLKAQADEGVFTEDGVQELLEIASSIQRNLSIRSVRSFISSDPEDPSSFLVERRVRATPSQAAAMNEALADRVSERADLMGDPGLKFVPMFIGMLP